MREAVARAGDAEVSASPSLVGALGTSLGTTADAFDRRRFRLRDALDTFFESRSELGPRESPVADILDHQTDVASDVADRIDRFLDALLLADRAGYTRPGQVHAGLPGDLVFVAHAALDLFTGDPGTRIFDEILRDLRSELVALEADPPVRSGRSWAGRDRHRRQLADLRRQIGQYQALARPNHLGWGRVTVSYWRDLAEFRAEVVAGAAAVETHLPAPGSGSNPRTRLRRDLSARRQFRREHPFLSAALDEDVLITPLRLETLLELDRFATMPIEEFLAARVVAEDVHAAFDWTADGCSGPIPAAARQACFRHDFQYRNARMIRDQWGTGQGFAERVKSEADERFGDELFDEYEWWDYNGGLVLWLWGAEAAVSTFGSVDDPWQPPDPDDFYGGAPPR